MTTPDTFGRDLSRWLHEDAEHRVPEHLTEVLVRTAATRQRPWWSSPERWLPMDTVAVGRPLNLRPVAVLLLIIGGLVLAAGALLWVASQRQEPFSLASNGRIFVIDGQTLKSYAADGTDGRVARNLPASAKDATTSPDGRSIAYIMDDVARLEVMDIQTGTATTVPLEGAVGVGGPISWSPDGTTMLFNTFDGRLEHLFTAKRDGTDVHEVAVSVPAAGGQTSTSTHVELSPAGWSPTGDRIAFVAVPVPDSGVGTLYVIRPDGSDLQAAGPARVWPYAVSWSPDPAVDLMLFTDDRGGAGFVQILDVSSGELTEVGPGFWPTWSPDGSRIAYWNDGTVVADTAGVLAGAQERVRPYQAFTGACDEHLDLADVAYCGPAAWSPDGQRLLAGDISGRSVLALSPDGRAQPIVIPLESPSSSGEAIAAWQPVRD